MAMFEEILPALRAGKKVRRQEWQEDSYVKAHEVMVKWDDGQDLVLSVPGLNSDDWEIVPEPKRVAIYLLKSTMFGDRGDWYESILEVGKQPTDAVLVPGSEREVSE